MKLHSDYLKEIAATGLSQMEIGERLKKTQSWVSAAMCGVYSDLRWRDGVAIRDLHFRLRPDLYPDNSGVAPVVKEDRRRVKDQRRGDRRSPDLFKDAPAEKQDEAAA